jgi:hypothetical protein
MKCATTKAANTNGSKKCKEKNLFNVAFDTEKPPQITKYIKIKHLIIIHQTLSLG